MNYMKINQNRRHDMCSIPLVPKIRACPLVPKLYLGMKVSLKFYFMQPTIPAFGTKCNFADRSFPNAIMERGNYSPMLLG